MIYEKNKVIEVDGKYYKVNFDIPENVKYLIVKQKNQSFKLLQIFNTLENAKKELNKWNKQFYKIAEVVK